VQPSEVIRIKGKGLLDQRGKRQGDLYIRCLITVPDPKGAKTLQLENPIPNPNAKLVKENAVEHRDGDRVWRRWREAERVRRSEKTIKAGSGRTEL